MPDSFDVFAEDSLFIVEKCPCCGVIYAVEEEPQYWCLTHRLAPACSPVALWDRDCCHVGEYIVDDEDRVIAVVPSDTCRVIDVYPVRETIC